MAMSTISSGLGKDQEIWNSLKEAIAKSSGFEQWQQEKKSDEKLTTLNIDERVTEYLRSTLETLAY